jgi:hypothetical protein
VGHEDRKQSDQKIEKKSPNCWKCGPNCSQNNKNKIENTKHLLPTASECYNKCKKI